MVLTLKTKDTNEKYLIVSYFVCAALSVALGSPSVFVSAASLRQPCGDDMGRAPRLDIEKTLAFRIAGPGSAGIRFCFLFELRADDLRRNCSKPEIPCREESGAGFFDLALRPRCGAHVGCCYRTPPKVRPTQQKVALKKALPD